MSQTFSIKQDGKTYKVTESQLCLHGDLKSLGFSVRVEEPVCPERAWRYDLFLPEHRIAVEINGGQYTGGHRTGFLGKAEYQRRKRNGLPLTTPQEDWHDKLNTATMNGVRVLVWTTDQVLDGRALTWMKEFARKERNHEPTIAK